MGRLNGAFPASRPHRRPGLPHHVTQLDRLRVGDFAAFLDEPFDEDAAYLALRRGETVGRPVGDASWLNELEERTGRRLAPGKRRRKPRQETG